MKCLKLINIYLIARLNYALTRFGVGFYYNLHFYMTEFL